MRADQLSPEQEQYFKSRLREHVGLQAQKGQPLSSDEIEKYASKLLKHTVNHVGDQATVRQQAYDDAKKTALQTVRALSGGGSESAPDLLLKLARSCERVVSDSMLDEGDVGGQDIENTRQRVINSAVSRLTPQMAKQLYDRAMSSNGTGRQLLLATRLAEDQVGGTDAHAIGGHGDLTGTLSTLVHQLGARAGIPLTRTDATIETIESVRTTGKGQHGVPADALRAAGVSDARKVGSLLTGVLDAVGERAGDYRKREADELREVEQIHQADAL
jgi:hypothetical protein